MTEPLWIFGYGSLVWRPAFAHVEWRPAFIRGWTRRFWQGSTDHRGVPGAPGRVVTLVEAPDETVWGAAYRVSSDDAASVLDGLDHRERGGYARLRVTAHFKDATEAESLVYIATPANPNYLGPAPLSEIASQVLGATGPSGANPEYVLRLADALRSFGVEDAHVFELESRVRERA